MTTTTKATTAGKLTTRATVTLALKARLGLTRLPMAPDTPMPKLGKAVPPMQVPKDPNTSMTALTITPVERAAGVPKLVAGLMLPVTVTEALLSVVADTPPPTKVLTPMVVRMPMLTATATQMLLDMDVTDPAPTPPQRDTAAGRLESTDTPMLMPLPRDTPNTAPMAVTGRMPAVMPTLPLTPLDALTADGAQLPRVPLMLSLARMATRTAMSTVAMTRTNTVTLMALLMPVLADTVATRLMVAVPALLVTVQTLAHKATPSVSVLLVEIVRLELAEAAMPVSTLEPMTTLMRDMAPAVPEVPLLVAPAMLVKQPTVTEETTRTLVPTAPELEQLVVMAVPTAALKATVLMERAHPVAMAETLDTVQLVVTAETLATAATATATATAKPATATLMAATERVATLIQVPTDSEATLEMMVIIEMVIVVMVIELSELSKQLLKEDTIPPMITCFKMCNKCNTDFLL